MGFGGAGGFRRFAHLPVLLACGFALANCSASSRVDPKYGVSASPRVVEPGDPVPKGGGVYRVGKPYTIAGRVYVPEEDPNYTATGIASWYGDEFHGRFTANGEIFDKESISAAHPTLPLPSYVRVTNLANRKSIIVRVNDRGPYHGNRVIDLSRKTAQLLGFHGNGVAKVKVDYVGRAPIAGSDDRKLMATLREGAPAQAPVQVASAGGFAPYFESRSIKDVPPPPTRPYRMGEGDAADRQQPASTVELAANSRVQSAFAQPMQQVPEVQTTSPVATYAPASLESRPSFMTGRGLY